MKLIKPNYSGRHPIVNDNSFVDGNPPMSMPTLGSPQASFNPGGKSSLFPNGPPKYIQPKGKRATAKGLSNKRLPQNNI